LTLVVPARRSIKDPRDPLWTGIDPHGAGLRAKIRQGRDKPAIRRQFAIGPDLRATLREIQEWRADAKAQLRVTRKVRATQGAFSLDAETYLALEAVQAMPVFKTGERTRHIEFWIAEFRDTQRSEIDKNRIENIYRRLLRTPRRAPRFQDPRRLANRRPDPRPITADTANKMLRALSNVWTMLDRPGSYNPVREVAEVQPAVVLVELASDELVSGGRSIGYADIERILAGMPDVGARTAAGGRATFSATKIRLRCMAYCQITESALMALTPGQINFKARCVALAPRYKAKGAPPIWTPVTTKALAAFRDFHAHDLYGPFAASAALRVWKGAARRVGLARKLGFRKYDLRHSVATALRRVTTDGEAVDYLLQHKIQGTTIVYTVDSIPDRIREAVARLDAYQQAHES
jgi:integrase